MKRHDGKAFFLIFGKLHLDFGDDDAGNFVALLFDDFDDRAEVV